MSLYHFLAPYARTRAVSACKIIGAIVGLFLAALIVCGAILGVE